MYNKALKLKQIARLKVRKKRNIKLARQQVHCFSGHTFIHLLTDSPANN